VRVVSVPRLKLLGACLAVRIAKKVTRALKVHMDTVHFWTDSTDVLCWIRQLSRKFKTFVANRVSYIQEATKPQQWNYVPTKMNPADLVSRGVPGRELPESELWWNGPGFLQQEETEWPSLKRSEIITDILISSEVALQTVVEEKCLTKHVNYFKPETLSTWTRLVRVRTWVQRFGNNCRRGRAKISEPEEMENVEKEIIRRDQMKYFEVE